MEEIRIPRPDDWHVHFRDGSLMEAVVHPTARIYRRALVMPNTTNPILTASDARTYHRQICHQLGCETRQSRCLPRPGRFQPFMTIKIVPSTTPRIVREAMNTDLVIAGKLYPDGVTTGSQGGVRDFKALDPVFAAMAEVGMVLCLHGEMPDVFCLDREEKFFSVLGDIRRSHPTLKIVLEHITTAAAVEMVKSLNGVVATITVHHLYLTLDDVIGDLLQPHHFCKPVAKRYEDRAALVAAATSGDRKFFLGTDSAPHLKGMKECAAGCAGVYVPGEVAMALLVELFLREQAIDKLAAFTSVNGALHYGFEPTTELIEIVRDEWTVPEIIEGVVPFMAGKKLQWRVPEKCWNHTRR